MIFGAGCRWEASKEKAGDKRGLRSKSD